jgi:hypothetical protein
VSLIAFWGAVELGLVYAFVAIGVYLAFRVLDFPDLTVDGSFPLGAAVTAVLIIAGVNPWLSAAVAMVAGGGAGLVTAMLNVRFRILNLLASILTMIALFSVNLRVMGKPNVALINAETMISPFFGLGLRDFYVRPLFVGLLVMVAVIVVWRFLESDAGLSMRATGANARMARAQGVEDRPPDLSRHGALQCAGGSRRRAVCADQRFCGCDLGRRHHRCRACRRHHRGDAVRRTGHSHCADRLRARLHRSIALPSSWRFVERRAGSSRHPTSIS